MWCFGLAWIFSHTEVVGSNDLYSSRCGFTLKWDFSPFQPQASVSPHFCLHYCLCAQAVPRQALAPVQRPEVEQANQSGNVGQFTKNKHEIEVKCAVCRCFT